MNVACDDCSQLVTGCRTISSYTWRSSADCVAWLIDQSAAMRQSTTCYSIHTAARIGLLPPTIATIIIIIIIINTRQSIDQCLSLTDNSTIHSSSERFLRATHTIPYRMHTGTATNSNVHKIIRASIRNIRYENQSQKLLHRFDQM